MTAKEKFQSLRHLILETPLDKQNICELETKCDLYADDIEQALTELEALKRYPTSDEVCEALIMDKRLFPKIFFYDEISKTFKEVHLTKNEEIVSYYADGTITININYGLPPHLITLIGRFYEGLGK